MTLQQVPIDQGDECPCLGCNPPAPWRPTDALPRISVEATVDGRPVEAFIDEDPVGFAFAAAWEGSITRVGSGPDAESYTVGAPTHGIFFPNGERLEREHFDWGGSRPEAEAFR